LISCPDKKGLIAAISSFISMHDGNILPADQYVSEGGADATFFMRLEIEGGGFGRERDEFRGGYEKLDAGPIIYQDVAHVTRRDTVEDMVRLGREVERRVLARAARWHLEDRILVDGIRTAVFE
jgi:formyltetrahydrofolate hydrolase